MTSRSEYIQHQLAVMIRWMRRYHLTELDWVQLAAQRYYQRHRMEVDCA